MPRTHLSLFCCCLALLAAGTASAQNFPAKPLRIITGGASGSLNDTLNRFVATEAGRHLGQTIVVENMPGAAGILAIRTVAKANPDGYTLLALQTTNSVASVFVKDPGFDMNKDLAPVTILANSPVLLKTFYGQPFNTLPEMAAFAKANPGKLNHGLPGPTDLFALYMGAIKSKYGITITDVAYKNSTGFHQALAVNEVQLAFSAVGNAIPQFKANQAKPLAVSGETRHPLFPNVPTFAELGLPEIEGLKFMTFTTGGTPRVVVDKLNSAYVAALKAPEVAPKLTALDLQIVASTPAALATNVAQSLERYRSIGKALGIEPE